MVFAPMVGWGDSTVGGIFQRSPASGERVGERVQSESVSEERGMSYSISCTCHNAHILSYDIACMLNVEVLRFITYFVHVQVCSNK